MIRSYTHIVPRHDVASGRTVVRARLERRGVTSTSDACPSAIDVDDRPVVVRLLGKVPDQPFDERPRSRPTSTWPRTSSRDAPTAPRCPHRRPGPFRRPPGVRIRSRRRVQSPARRDGRGRRASPRVPWRYSSRTSSHRMYSIGAIEHFRRASHRPRRCRVRERDRSGRPGRRVRSVGVTPGWRGGGRSRAARRLDRRRSPGAVPARRRRRRCSVRRSGGRRPLRRPPTSP